MTVVNCVNFDENARKLVLCTVQFISSFRQHDSPPVPSEIAEYSLALSSICRDPRQFYGIDLIGIITHHELLLEHELAVVSLAVCASGGHVRKRQLRGLLEITESHENLSIGKCVY